MDHNQELERIRAYFNNDKYATEVTGIKITDARERYAKVELDLDERHCNALHAVMGGVYFTMCDFAFAIASNYNSVPCVTLGTHSIFMNRNRGTHLICEAKCIKDGRTTCFYDLMVTDDQGTEIAKMTFEGYKILKAEKVQP